MDAGFSVHFGDTAGSGRNCNNKQDKLTFTFQTSAGGGPEEVTDQTLETHPPERQQSGLHGPQMDPLDFLDQHQLLEFFRRKKTEMSLMEQPHSFLSQLRDHNLIPEDRYQKMTRMKNKETLKRAVYNVLDWLERERSQHIPLFWSCIFNDTIRSKYPTLQMLRNSLMDGSFQFNIQLPKRVEKEETAEGKRTELSEDEEERANSVKKKRKRSMCVMSDEDEEAGPSSHSTPGQRKKKKKICYSSPLKKGERTDIWTWPLYKVQLPVKCGNQDGMLNRDRLAKGTRCILVDDKWLTPSEFERFAGKETYKNWTLSIKCVDTPLRKLIQEGHLKPGNYRRGSKKAKKSLFPSNGITTVPDEEDEESENDEDDEEQVSSSGEESSSDDTDNEEETAGQTVQHPEVFDVTCGDLVGTLHRKRFASGTCGKSIRTETSWMSPVEFVQAALRQTDASWRKDIMCEGKPLGVLTEAEILRCHSVGCPCRLCTPDSEDLDDQKNDDKCWICKKEDEDLVMCDDCPRSFHQKCHLPHVEDAIIQCDEKWTCTFCVYRANQGYFCRDELKKEAAMSLQISPRMLECQYLLLNLCCADEDQTFATDPNLCLADYSAVIQTPMWLRKIADKLKEKRYTTVGEFVSDIELIFTNCASYNRDNAEFLARGNRLKELFEEQFKELFKIRE